MIAPSHRALLAAALIAASPSAAPQGVTARTVVLGQSAPLSGPHREQGEEIRNGALAYLRRLNDAGGVHGRRLELATLDDAGDPERALANTRRFIEEFGVFALLAYPERSATPEVLEAIHKAGMPLIAPISGMSDFRRPGRAVFAVRAGIGQEVDRIVDFYAGLGQKRMVIVRAEGAGGAPWAAAAHEALAKRGLAPPRDIPLGAAKATAAGREARAADAQVVIVALAQPPAAEVVKALKAARPGAQIVATSLADPDSLLRALGTGGTGVTLAQSVPPLERISLPVVAEYREAYAAETGAERYSPASLEAFIGANVLAEAVRRTGRALTREKFLLALGAMSTHDTGGHVVRYSRTARGGGERIYLLAIGRDGTLLH